MAQRPERNPFVYLSGAFAAAWVVAAWLQPTSSFYLFPALIAGILPLSYRINGSRPLGPGAAMGAAVAGIINVVIVAVLLSVAGKLDGPRLVDVGPPVVEAMALAIVGAAIGAGLSMLPQLRR